MDSRVGPGNRNVVGKDALHRWGQLLLLGNHYHIVDAILVASVKAMLFGKRGCPGHHSGRCDTKCPRQSEKRI